MAEKQVKFKIDILPFDNTGYNLGSSGDNDYPWDNIYANNLKVGNVNISGALTVAGDSINFGDLIINGPKDVDNSENQGLLYSAQSHSLLYNGTSPSPESTNKPFILLDNSEYAEDGGDAVFHVLAKIKDSQNKYWMLGVVGNGTNRPSAFAIVNSDTGLDATSATKNKFFFTPDGMLTLDRISTKEIVCNTDTSLPAAGAGTIYARSLDIKKTGEDIKDGTSLAAISSDGAIKCTALTSSGAISSVGITNTGNINNIGHLYIKDSNNIQKIILANSGQITIKGNIVINNDSGNRELEISQTGRLSVLKLQAANYGSLSNRPAASSAITGQVYFVTA